MAMINTRPIKKPLGRIVREIFSRPSPTSQSRLDSTSTCLWLQRKTWFVLCVIAFGCGICYYYYYSGRLIEPDTLPTLLHSETVTNNEIKKDQAGEINSKLTSNYLRPLSESKSEDIEESSSEDSSNSVEDQEDSIHVKVRLSTIHHRPIRIFCYGDSLTAGMSPPLRVLFPYSQVLQTTLTERIPPEDDLTFQVDHAGFPGWTSLQLFDQVSKTSNNTNVQKQLLQRDPDNPTDASYYDILIYLAGTNDLGLNKDPTDIVTNIMNVHIWAHHTAKIPFTIALLIPPSAYQRSNPSASQKASAVNKQLTGVIQQDFAQSTFIVPFPIPFPDLDSWSKDGLHLSHLGYERLGQYMASMIMEQILTI